MPRTKKLSYRQRNKAITELRQYERSNQACHSQPQTPATETLSQETVEQQSVGHPIITDIFLQNIHTHDTFTFFPPNDLWCHEKIALLKQLISANNEHILTYSSPKFPNICSPILYTNTATLHDIWRIVS